MMPRRSTVTNLFIVRFFIFDIFSSNEYYEHGVVVFSFDEPGPGDNPGHKFTIISWTWQFNWSHDEDPSDSLPNDHRKI